MRVTGSQQIYCVRDQKVEVFFKVMTVGEVVYWRCSVCGLVVTRQLERPVKPNEPKGN